MKVHPNVDKLSSSSQSSRSGSASDISDQFVVIQVKRIAITGLFSVRLCLLKDKTKESS